VALAIVPAPQPISPSPFIVQPTLAGLATWRQLLAHIGEYFYDPDIGALEIGLSACVAHFHKDTDPVWLFVLGNSGGDKTSIICNCCLAIESSHLMGDITPKTFLSGYTGKANSSLLHQIGSGILVFKDFTTFMSKRHEEQAEIASQLREIFDGYWKRNTGKGDDLIWKGKMTVLAAATPALERAWGSLGDLGERFLQVRIPRKDGLKQAGYAQRQAGKEGFIQGHMKDLANRLLKDDPKIGYPLPRPNEEQQYRISCIAELVAHSRGKVPRNFKGEIIGLPEIENSSRASKELNSLVSGHAALFRRSTIDDDMDMWVASRVGKNSMPINRYILLNTIASQQDGLDVESILKLTKMPPSTIRWVLAELNSLGLVYGAGTDPIYHRLTDPIRHLWDKAFSQPLAH
jgi:hypothetical protein